MNPKKNDEIIQGMNSYSSQLPWQETPLQKSIDRNT